MSDDFCGGREGGRGTNTIVMSGHTLGDRVAAQKKEEATDGRRAGRQAARLRAASDVAGHRDGPSERLPRPEAFSFSGGGERATR